MRLFQHLLYEYITYSLNPQFRSLKIDFEGKDFFKQLIPDAEKVVHPDDKHIFQNDIQKDNLLQDIKDGIMREWIYRLMIDGKPVYHELRMIRGDSDTDDYFILGVTNVDKKVRTQKERNTYNQIAESLASRYDIIYYINIENNHYIEFSASNCYRALGVPPTGDDFFTESIKNLTKYAYPDDISKMLQFINKQNILSQLKTNKSCRIEYRLHLNGEYRYIKLMIMIANDQKHLILCVEDIDDQVKQENEHIRKLLEANERAMTDELTGVKNKNSYQEMESILQTAINKGTIQPFGLLVCDLNNLKQINDTLGHKAGDAYIQEASRLLCDIFKHSPVYRIGGDEFTVLLKQNDFTDRNELIQKLTENVRRNLTQENKPVIAVGFAEFNAKDHRKVADVFELADTRMYNNKKELKQQ